MHFVRNTMSVGILAVALLLGTWGCESSTRDSATVTVGSQGGTITLGDARIEIPPGALSQDTVITVARTAAPAPAPDETESAGDVFSFTPHGTLFNTPITIQLPYTGLDNDLSVLRLDDENDTLWEAVEGVTFSGGLATFLTDSL